MPPITAPAMRPGEGPELLEEDAIAASEEVDSAADCEATEAIEDSVVGIDAVLLLVLDAIRLACDVVRAGDAAGKLGRAVGIVMSLVDRNETTMPPTLFRILPICLRSWLYLRWTCIAATLPAALHSACTVASALMRPGCTDGRKA
jgi:hypothetical protein